MRVMATMVVVITLNVMAMVMEMSVVTMMGVAPGMMMMMRRPRGGRSSEGKYCDRTRSQRDVLNYSTKLTQLHHSWIPYTPPILATTCSRGEWGL